MRLFRTDSSDFSDEELLKIKESLGQIYLDVSSKLAPDDFVADLKKLTLSRECERCAHRAGCGGSWQLSAGGAFERDDGFLRDILGTLDGDLLDVGCGEGVYVADIAQQVEAGQATYLGVDPDEARVGLLASRHPWARYHVGTVLDLLQGPESFDHVLVLRSYNHLPDPREAMMRAVQLLRPGGRLLVADNVAFGLVRSKEHASRAEGGPGAFEHYRNDSSVEAHAVCDALPLRLEERRDVGPETSNQWLLQYRKVGHP